MVRSTSGLCSELLIIGNSWEVWKITSAYLLDTATDTSTLSAPLLGCSICGGGRSGFFSCFSEVGL